MPDLLTYFYVYIVSGEDTPRYVNFNCSSPDKASKALTTYMRSIGITAYQVVSQFTGPVTNNFNNDPLDSDVSFEPQNEVNS